jgi:hypothetical protein
LQLSHIHSAGTTIIGAWRHDCYGSTTVGKSGDYSGHKVSRHSRVVSMVDYSFWDEYIVVGLTHPYPHILFCCSVFCL